MPISHTNCYGQIYYLHEGKTKTGKPKYFMSKMAEGNLAESVPGGYEIYERPGGVISVRKIPKTPILPHELKYVQDKIAPLGDKENAELEKLLNKLYPFEATVGGKRQRMPFELRTRFEAEIKGKEIIVYEVRGGRVTPMLKFTLLDEDTREYSAEHWYIGKHDRWRHLKSGQLRNLVNKYCPKMPADGLYERYAW